MTEIFEKMEEKYNNTNEKIIDLVEKILEEKTSLNAEDNQNSNEITIQLKENIIDATNKLDDLCKIKVRQYNFINDQDKVKQIGVIAQDLEKVLPEVVAPAPFDSNKYGSSISNQRYLTVRYDRIVPLLIEALKEQKEQIDYIKSNL